MLVRYALTFSFCFASASAAFAAPIVAHFDADDGTTSVDQYKGIAGDGWTTPWVSRVMGTIINGSTGVVNTSPLAAGAGNYLSVNVNSGTSGGTNKTVGISRSYGGSYIDLTQPHTISFLYRLDSGLSTLNSTTEYLGFTELPTGSSASDASVDSSWMIRAYGVNNGGAVAGHWAFYNGNPASTALDAGRFHDTGVALVEDHTYRFTIDTNPTSKTYTASVEDLATLDSFTSDDLNFRNYLSNPTSSGGQLLFGSRYSVNGLNRIFQLDEIQVTAVPEPSSLALAALACPAWVYVVRRRARASLIVTGDQ